MRSRKLEICPCVCRRQLTYPEHDEFLEEHAKCDSRRNTEISIHFLRRPSLHLGRIDSVHERHEGTATYAGCFNTAAAHQVDCWSKHHSARAPQTRIVGGRGFREIPALILTLPVSLHVDEDTSWHAEGLSRRSWRSFKEEK